MLPFWRQGGWPFTACCGTCFCFDLYLLVSLTLLVHDCLCRYGQLLSSEPLRVNFHPSSLLSIGDLLAFVRDLTSATAASSSTALTVAQPLLQPAEPSLVQITDEHMHGLDSANGGNAERNMQQLQQAHGQEQLHAAPVMQPTRALACAEAPPSIEEQMALADGLTSRIPQR